MHRETPSTSRGPSPRARGASACRPSCLPEPYDEEVSMGQQGDGWKAAAIDDIPPVKPDWPATWKSMRHHFGITAFGVNAVTKDAGNVLIPEHEHGGSGEQE